MRVGLAQLNTTVGDLGGNFQKILNAYQDAVARGADLVLTPELAITGYPPQDLVFKSRFVPLTLETLERLNDQVGEVPLVVGFVDYNEQSEGRPFHNAAALLQRGRKPEKIYKSLLPTYDVFDEDRYFEPAEHTRTLQVSESRIGLTICEDIWTGRYLPRRLYGRDPVRDLVKEGADLILNISASPFNVGKPSRRFEMISQRAAQHGKPIFCCNSVGGNDQLIFDGCSFAVNGCGELIAQLSGFREEVAIVDSDAAPSAWRQVEEPEELWEALSLGLRDYAFKCGFQTAVLGLSGGIDSAVTACIAVNAFGAENVWGVTMPTEYSSRGSIEDSAALATNLGIRFLEISIQDTFEEFREQFRNLFATHAADITEENMQPRLRAMTLMALSNKFGHLLLTTGNKSELAVGYCTLYGDMAGGLAVISDVPKTMVYRLAKWINRKQEIIPGTTIEKPPSAELKPGQNDQDTLPPYELLDEILQLYVEENLSSRDIIKRGFDEQTVRWIQRRVDLNEYKREQAAPGLKVTSRAFGIGRRMPIAQKFVD